MDAGIYTVYRGNEWDHHPPRGKIQFVVLENIYHFFCDFSINLDFHGKKVMMMEGNGFFSYNFKNLHIIITLRERGRGIVIIILLI